MVYVLLELLSEFILHVYYVSVTVAGSVSLHTLCGIFIPHAHQIDTPLWCYWLSPTVYCSGNRIIFSLWFLDAAHFPSVVSYCSEIKETNLNCISHQACQSPQKTRRHLHCGKKKNHHLVFYSYL